MRDIYLLHMIMLTLWKVPRTDPQEGNEMNIACLLDVIETGAVSPG